MLTAIGLLAEIGDINWFASSKQLIAYAGLATIVRQSNEVDRHPDPSCAYFGAWG
jgi:transposase